MKYLLSVFLGAASYGILSTIVVFAYGQGYKLGEVVGSQLLMGFILAWALALFTKWRERRLSKRDELDSQSTTTVSGIANKPPGSRLTWKQRLLLMAAGAPTAITGLLYYQSLKHIPASLAIILLFQFTWISIVVQAVRQRRRPSGPMMLGLAVLLVGTLLAAGILEQGTSQFNMTGVILGLLSAVSYTLFIWFSGKAVPGAHPAYRSAWMLAGALALVFILFTPAFLFDGTLWGGLFLIGLMLGFFGAFIPPVLFAVGVPRIGEGMAGILGASELPVAVMMSAFVLNEYVSALQWAGVAAVLIGIALPELLKRKRGKQAYHAV
ncbi:EamA family transporter [Paenibacillus harenae]|uniref:EamA family transporter n=1 Tax=Paenibacillus harenae TaxID=306543 RepID=UPI002793FA18|nr:EamA family transporter [Paenibacillus harenae]MDQ0057926.1 drug/metabolite transporter (DMT)-like permease [Paenibacillus harenae]